MIEQPFHRPSAGPGDAVLDLLHLLGDMDMDGTLARHRHEPCELLRCRGTQAVRRQPELAAVEPVGHRAAPLHEPFEAFERIDETPLAIDGGSTAETGMGIKDRQQRQANTGLFACRPDALGKLGDIGIGAAISIMVEIVEFADAGKTGLKHFRIKFGRHRLDMRLSVIARANLYMTVRQLQKLSLAGPRTSARLSHRPLEGMAVQVRHGGNKQSVAFVARPGKRADFDPCDAPGFERQPHILLPALRGQRRVCVKCGHGLPSPFAVPPIFLFQKSAQNFSCHLSIMYIHVLA